ncbi:hypothetical protein MtrunA17_Chr8g0346611 [Medicago truncatula]|uniref:Uncharacterized protein n=2 Tax=Medicago truncatula TaxID=3880 RepID=A0A072TMH2_MEDTR|nr:uncharacterized protein LOC25500659 isoform X1 [Medicago truncatula]KEH18622.1 hypothetical protein MTR_8g027390 [Medicago truncatula]RHN39694.1 hypothetical protein MtrunA17_Chr8g0346611 [Medicago truncatula]
MAGTACNDLSEDLRLVLLPLENTSIPVQTWTITELAKHFITTRSFIDNVKTITLISSNIVCDTVITLAIQRGFWAQNSKCTPTTMMKFCSFLKSKEGSQILDDFQKKAELWNVMKRRMAEIEAVIAYHRGQIVLLEKKLENEIAEVESCYLPASQYVPLDEQELLKRCYDMYVAETIKSKLKVKELDQELIEFIKFQYEKDVRMAHMMDFMADEMRRLVLNVWTG